MTTTRTSRKKRVYKVIFVNEGKVYEIYAKSVGQGGMFGFVEVEGLLFGEKSSLVIDPAEESLQREFSAVERTYIPLHSVVRIDEVEQRGSRKWNSAAPARFIRLPSPTARSPSSRPPSIHRRKLIPNPPGLLVPNRERSQRTQD